MATIPQGHADLLFDLTGVEGPRIDVDIELRLVAKLPVDMKAVAEVGAGFHEYGDDLGEGATAMNRKPLPTKDLPPGIREVYRT